MVLELLGTRIISPYLGSSIVTWTSLIGIVLTFLALGYYVGGLWAAKKPSLYKLSLLLLASGVWVCFIAIFKDVAMSNISRFHLAYEVKVIASSVFLLAAPSFFLGAVTPYLVGMSLKDLKESTQTVGTLYSLSTLGSIAGTFLAGFWLIPHFGHTKLLYIVAISVIFFSILISSKLIFPKITLIIFCIWAFINGFTVPTFNTNVIIDKDTSYYRIWIDKISDKTGQVQKRMFMDGAQSSAIIVNRDDKLVFSYYPYYEFMYWHKSQVKDILMVGGAGLGYPRYAAYTNPNLNIQVVELDRSLEKINKQYFDYRGYKNIEVLYSDGRRFIKDKKQTYDAILFDAFSSYTIPFHLVTKEAVEEVKSALKPDGIVVINFISARTGKHSKILQSLNATYGKVFPYVKIFAVNIGEEPTLPQNFALIASNTPLLESSTLSPETAKLLKNEITPERDWARILTDDWAPIDYWSGLMFSEQNSN